MYSFEIYKLFEKLMVIKILGSDTNCHFADIVNGKK